MISFTTDILCSFVLAQFKIARCETLDAYAAETDLLLGGWLMLRVVALRDQPGGPPMTGNNLLGYVINQNVL